MGFTKPQHSLNKENIFKKVDSYQLFKRYCSGFSALGTKFKSEFRTDSDPSCHIIMWDGELLYKDFGEEKGYRIFDFIARKFNVDFHDAMHIVNKDFNLGLGGKSLLIQWEKAEVLDKSPVLKKNKRPTIIQVTPRRWTDNDRRYWKQYEIPPLLLKYHNIFSIAGYSMDSDRRERTYFRTNPGQLAYTMDYYWHEDVFRRKLYFPQTKGIGKFIANIDSTIVQGWSLLPKNGSDILFVTKSYKDILTFNMLGLWAIAPNSEHAYIPEHVMNKLKQRFSNIFVWFDNDEGGLKGAAQFADKFTLPFTYNPIGEPKDPSDYVKKYSLKKFGRLVTQFLNNEGHSNYCP